MIKNILFDMGGVLLFFKSKYFISKVTDNQEIAELLYTNIFHSEEWRKLDNGTFTEQEAYDSCIKRLPFELHEAAFKLIFEWDKWSYQIEGSEKLLKDLKDKGYKMFLLSNASKRLHNYAPRIIKNFDLLDGVIVSADIKMVKPNKEIFEYACNKFNIKAQESLFTDDLLENVKGAKNACLNAVQFIDVNTFRNDLKEYDVNL